MGFLTSLTLCKKGGYVVCLSVARVHLLPRLHPHATLQGCIRSTSLTFTDVFVHTLQCRYQLWAGVCVSGRRWYCVKNDELIQLRFSMENSLDLSYTELKRNLAISKTKGAPVKGED